MCISMSGQNVTVVGQILTYADTLSVQPEKVMVSPGILHVQMSPSVIPDKT